MSYGDPMKSHITDSKVENARWLMSPAGCNLSLTAVARRLGMTEDAVEQMLRRADAQSHPDTVEGDRQPA